MLAEVGHADGADLPRRLRLLERRPRGEVPLVVGAAAEVRPGLGGVDEHEVEVVQSHPLEGLVDGRGRGVVVLDLGGELRGDEDLLAGHGGAADALADAALVAVGLGGVDVAVADLDGVADRLGGVGVVDEPGAEPQDGDLDAVRQHARLSEGGGLGHSSVPSGRVRGRSPSVPDGAGRDPSLRLGVAGGHGRRSPQRGPSRTPVRRTWDLGLARDVVQTAILGA